MMGRMKARGLSPFDTIFSSCCQKKPLRMTLELEIKINVSKGHGE